MMAEVRVRSQEEWVCEGSSVLLAEEPHWRQENVTDIHHIGCLVLRYNRARQNPPLVLYTDRDCCIFPAKQKTKELFKIIGGDTDFITTNV